ncbi:MAG: cupredoxin domain-containing protein [Polaromonas sp.]|nr:cupredoxin domain-containing protein [Gemmatimonadaceae bacterium]
MGKVDGKVHAITSNANFSLKVGQPVTIQITNADDDMTHSFTSAALGVDEKLPPAKNGKPTVKNISITPSKVGEFDWLCTVPCDPYAMATKGMMRGTITVTK